MDDMSLPTELWTIVAQYCDYDSITQLVFMSKEIQSAIIHYFRDPNVFRPTYDDMFRTATVTTDTCTYRRAYATPQKAVHYVDTLYILLKLFRQYGYQFPISDPSSLFLWAAEFGFQCFEKTSTMVSILLYLLDDNRVDPSSGDNLALSVIVRIEDEHLTKRVLSDKRVNLHVRDNDVIKTAIETHQQNIFEFLLSRVNVNNLLHFTIRKGTVEMVTMLLADDRVDLYHPAMSAAIVEVARTGHGKMLRVLLADDRITIPQNAALMARVNGWEHIAELLENHVN
jgi:hypothetical protein